MIHHHLTRCVAEWKRRSCVSLLKMSALHIKVGLFFWEELSWRATEHVSHGLWNHSDIAHPESGLWSVCNVGISFRRLHPSNRVKAGKLEALVGFFFLFSLKAFLSNDTVHNSGTSLPMISTLPTFGDCHWKCTYSTLFFFFFCQKVWIPSCDSLFLCLLLSWLLFYFALIKHHGQGTLQMEGFNCTLWFHRDKSVTITVGKHGRGTCVVSKAAASGSHLKS